MTEDSAIDISIIIAAWRAGATLARCLDSCLAQTNIRTQIIVIDDCSPDDTLSIATRYSLAHQKIHVLQTPRRSGPAATRNLGIAAAQGRWIAVVDADDSIEPRRFECLLSDPSAETAAILFDNMTVIEKGKSKTFLKRAMPTTITLEYFVENNLPYLSKPTIGYLKPLIRRAFLNHHHIFYDSELLNSEDYLLVIEILAAGGTARFFNHHGYNYYVNDNSISASFNVKYNNRFITAERAFLKRHTTLSDREKKVIEKHIRYRTLSEDIHNSIQALKHREMKVFFSVLFKNGLMDAYTIARVITDIVVLKIIGAKSRI